MSASTHHIGVDPLTVHLGRFGEARIRSSVPFAIGGSRYAEGWGHLVTTGNPGRTVQVRALGGHEGSIEVTPQK